jgi:hypothetical protein
MYEQSDAASTRNMPGGRYSESSRMQAEKEGKSQADGAEASYRQRQVLRGEIVVFCNKTCRG